jgi:hypothetical protein
MRLSVAAVLLLFLASTASAQPPASFARRWRILVHPADPSAEPLRGELRLQDSAGALTGTLRLESDSGAPIPLSSLRFPASDSIEFDRMAGGDWAFFGIRRTGTATWAGNVRRGGRPAGRWEADSLGADREFYPAIPRFMLHQTILGTRDRPVRAPGSWLGAAEQFKWETVEAPDAERWLMGFEERDRWREGIVRDLAALRGRLDAAARRRFDGLFEPERGWIADLHDAALRSVRGRGRPGAGWEAWRPALAGAGLVAAGTDRDDAAVMEAAYRLWVLGTVDSAAQRARLDAIRPFDVAGDMELLLYGYRQAAVWHVAATSFLAGVLDPADEAASIPVEIEVTGRPRAAGHVALEAALATALVQAVNWEGERWLERRGPSGLARVLRRVAPDYGDAASVELGGARFELTTPAAEAERAAGSFGPASVVRYDPGEPPLFAALRAIVERERIRVHTAWRAGPGVRSADEMRLLLDPEPHLTAGQAERAADLALATWDLPSVRHAVAVRRSIAAAQDAAGDGVIGGPLVAALARATGDPTLGETRADVVRIGYEWEAVPRRPGPARAWSRWQDRPSRTLAPGRGPQLIPEITFVVEDGLPHVAEVRVLGFPG